MSDSRKIVRVFVISPNDVKPERKIVRELCQQLSSASAGKIDVEAVMWEYHPMSYHKNPQENIDVVMDECDIFIVILWYRLGSVVEGLEGALSGDKNITGTQYEIEKIIASKKESVYFYFKTLPKNFYMEELASAYKQKQQLENFLKKIGLTKGTTKHAYQDFSDEEEFRDKLQTHLLYEIQRKTGIAIKTSPTKSHESSSKKNMIKKRSIVFGILVFSFMLLVVGYFLSNKNDLSILKTTIEKRTELNSKYYKEIARSKEYLEYKNQYDPFKAFDLNSLFFHQETVLPKEIVIAAKKDFDRFLDYLRNRTKQLQLKISEITKFQKDNNAVELKEILSEYCDEKDIEKLSGYAEKKNFLIQTINQKISNINSMIKKYNKKSFFHDFYLLKLTISNNNSNDILISNNVLIINHGANSINARRIKQPLTLIEMMSVPTFTGASSHDSYKKNGNVILPAHTIKKYYYKFNVPETFKLSKFTLRVGYTDAQSSKKRREIETIFSMGVKNGKDEY